MCRVCINGGIKVKTEKFDINKLGSKPVTKSEAFDVSRLGSTGEADPEFVKKINFKKDTENIFSDIRFSRNRLNYVTDSKGETIIPNTDPIKKAQKEAERQEFLLTTPVSAYYDEDYTNRLNYRKGNISLNERMLVETAKNKIFSGKDLNVDERMVVKKYGVDSVLGNTLKGQYDIFAADNPYNISRSKRFKEYAQKEMNGGTLTEAERDAIETFKLLEVYKKQTVAEEFKMNGDVNSNAEKLANVAARSMYNDTAYGGTIKIGDSSIKIDELPIASDKEKEIHTSVNKLGNQLDLYTKTGLANYFVNTTDGLKTGWNIITGQDTVSDLKDKIDTPYAIASAVLKQHFTENGERVNMMLQDTVTNMAQNAIPMTAAILTAGMGGGALLTQFVSTAAFAPSVFGGAYKEGIQKGVTDPRKLFAYATITTVAECGLEAALGASFNPAGGVLTGEIVSSLSSKFSNVFAKVALKVGGNAIGEFVEESVQSILSPLLTEVILGVDDTTVFDDPIASLSQAAYEGLIGALSASLMGGPSNVVGAINEAGIQTYGKNYKAVVRQVGGDINNIAAYFKEVSKNKNLARLCDKVLSGDHSDLTIGEMLVAANQLSESAAQQMYSKIGEKITSLEGGVEAVLSLYNENVANGAVYPDKISKLYQTVKSDNENNTVKDADIGQLAVQVQAYAPRSLILGQTLEKLEAKVPALQSNANGENSALQSGAEGGIINQGGEENGQNIRDGSERTWGGSGDTEGGVGNLQTANAGIRGTSQANSGIEGNRPLFHNQGNQGIGVSPEQSENLKTTAIRNEDGTPKVTYHFTSNMDFETFNEGDIGFHFGNISQAEQRKNSLVANGKINADSGRVIQAFLNIKNPIRINTDIMTWWPLNTAMKLESMNIISESDVKRIWKLQDEDGYSYNSSAAVELRRILAEKGYDGIVYDNHFEGDGESYIAFYPEQVIIIDDGKPNTQADSENGPASFMPENDSSDNDSREPGFREADAKEIYRKSTEKDFDILTGKRKNAAQRQMEAVAEKFGVKIGYKDDITKGYYDPELKTIYMNPVWSLTEQYFVLFKHELTHHLENYKAYDSFKRYVVNFSNSFDAYVRDRLKDELGEEFKGSRKEALKAYSDIVLKQRQASKEIPDRIKKSYNPESIEREIVADFVGEVMLGGKDAAKAEAALMEIAKTEHRTVLEKIRDWVNEWVSIIKGEPQNRTLAEDLEYLNRRIARVLDSKEIKKSTTQSGVVKFDIAVLENGNTYVKASRNIIKGKTLSEQRNDITNFFKKLLKNKPSIDIHTIEGDILTLTMDETADKARDNYEVVKGQRIKMSEDEFAVKLRVESHIDEIVETSIKSNKPLSRDAKGHDFAKDGFEYRTAYFEDFDGKYYKIRFSIGHNGTVATVYNVGKIKEDVPSSAKLIAVVGSQALDGTSSNDIILNEEDSVKNNISREGEKYSSDNANSKHSIASEAFSKKLAELTEDVKSGKIGFDEFAKQVNDLAMKEHRIGEELMRALTEQEKLAKDFQEGAKRAEKLRDKIIMRQNKELMRSRRELKQEVESEREMYADRLTNLDCIRRSIKRIDSKLRANTNDKHVPEHLKMLANEVVSLFVANDTTPFKRSQLEKIKAFYDRGLNSKKADDAFIAAYDPEISENFEKLSELIEGKKLRDLDWLESTRVRTLVEHVEYLINSGNEMFVAGKKVETDEIGLSAIQRLLGQNTKVRIMGTQQIEAGIKYANMTPIYFFDRVGGVLKELFNDIVAGQDKWYRNVEMGKAYIRNIKEKYRYSEWKDKTIEFNTEDGESIELTVEQAMLLYATAQREYRDKTKQTNHLLKGGIVIEAQPLSIKAITTKLKDGKGKDAFLEEVNSRAHRITEGDIKKVFDLLSDEQIAYADALVEYLSNDMAALGNEVSMKLHGIRKYTSEYYIPYNSAANFLNMQMGVTNDARLKHQSFTKAVSEGAVTPLVLSNITEVCADHINRMSMYHALTIPLDAMERVLNYQIPGKENDGTESGAAGKSVASEITRIYGESAANYLKTFINDMNGTVRRSGDETIMNSMISKFKKSAVLASASVTIQQPSAVMRSMAYIDPKYFIKTTLKIAERDYQQLMQYAPGVAGIKAMGRFDTGTGVSTVKWMLQEEPKGLSQKAKAFVDLKDSTYRDDILSWTAAKADEITWAHIWAAVKAEVADKTTLKPGTDEFFKACGRRFTQVINYTQVYDSTLSRSQIMRNKSTAATMMTAFMSEPTVSLNLLMDAVYQAQKGTKASKKFAARAVGAFVGNVLLNAALKSLVTAARDDDEDETYLEKYISAFTGNFTDDIFLLNSIPYVKDIYSSFKGYTVERADMSLFSDLAEAVRMLSNDNKTPLEKIEKIAGALAAFLGLPVKNVIRDMKAAWNVIDMAFISKPKGDLQGAIFAVTGIEGGERYEALAEAAEKGNDAEYQRIYKHLIDSGLSDEDIKTNVQMFYRKDQGIIKQTKTYMKELADNKTYQGFDNETKEKIKSDITTILAKEKTVEALAREPDRFDKLYEAKRKSKAQYEKLKKEMLDEGMSESLIKSGEEIAKVAYMKSIGIDIAEYLLFKTAISEKYADTDGSGGVSNREKQDAAKKLDIDTKAKQWLMKN